MKIKFTICFVVAVVALLPGCSSSPEQSLVNDAAAAIGGADRIRSVRSLLVEGTGENFFLGQNVKPDGPLPVYKITEFKRASDFDKGQWRQEQVRVPQFVTGNMAPQKQITAVDGNVAFNIGVDGKPTRAAESVAKDRQAELYHHP